MAKRTRFEITQATCKYLPWTSQAIENLITLRDVEEMEWDEISRIIGHSVLQCIRRYQIVTGFRGRERRRKSLGMPLVDEKLLADRDQRQAAQYDREQQALARGDLSHLIGDLPPPGRSALDKRRANA